MGCLDCQTRDRSIGDLQLQLTAGYIITAGAMHKLAQHENFLPTDSTTRHQLWQHTHQPFDLLPHSSARPPVPPCRQQGTCCSLRSVQQRRPSLYSSLSCCSHHAAGSPQSPAGAALAAVAQAVSEQWHDRGGCCATEQPCSHSSLPTAPHTIWAVLAVSAALLQQS